MTGEQRKVLLIFIEDTDTWEGERLYEAIVLFLHGKGIAGATAWTGIMGYGAHGRIHRKGLFGVSDEKPVVVAAIDTEEKLRAVLPELLLMVKEGLVILQDAEVFAGSSEDDL
jgi:PII-like signaling protein